MTLLTEIHPIAHGSVSPEDGREGGNDPAVLEVPVEWPEFCWSCLRECRFISYFTRDEGFIAECLGCGDERVIPFSRENSEGC